MREMGREEWFGGMKELHLSSEKRGRHCMSRQGKVKMKMSKGWREIGVGNTDSDIGYMNEF